MPTRPTKTSTGFTLVELLVTLTVLAILAAVLLPQFRGMGDGALNLTVSSNLATVRQAIELYKVQHGDSLPDAAIVAQLTTGTNGMGDRGTQYGPYLRAGFPRNPITGDASVEIVPALPLVATGRSGWIYDLSTGAIRLNCAGKSSDGRAWYTL